MNEYGLSNAGFKAKKYQQIKEELEAELKSFVDPTLRFTPDTVAGVLTGIVAHQCAQVWEMLQGLYSSLDANTASGHSLDAICFLTGTKRMPAEHSHTKALVRLAANTILPKGSIAAVEHDANARFLTDAELKNDSNNEAILEVAMTADEPGPIYAPATKLNKILTPQAGWLGISNPKDAILGRLPEDDQELRLRRVAELKAMSGSSNDSIKAHLEALPGVQAAHIEESLHQFTAYVMGGEEQDICEALWKNH